MDWRFQTFGGGRLTYLGNVVYHTVYDFPFEWLEDDSSVSRDKLGLATPW